MFRKLLLCLCILLIPFVGTKAQQEPDRPAGLFLCCFDYYGQRPMDQCTVRCSNAYSGQFVIADYTNWNPYPPHYNRARFAAAHIVPPGQPIPYGEYALYGFYAKRWMENQNRWMYSRWSRVMKYPDPSYEDWCDLNLTEYEPPDIRDLIQQVPSVMSFK